MNGWKNRRSKLIRVGLTQSGPGRALRQGGERIVREAAAGIDRSGRSADGDGARVTQDLLDGLRLGRTESLSRVVRQIAKGPVSAQPESGIMIEPESVAHDRHHLGLLHGVDTEIGLELVVEVQLFDAVARSLGHNLEDRLENERRGLRRRRCRYRGRRGYPLTHRLTGGESGGRRGEEIRYRRIRRRLHIKAERGERREGILETRESSPLGMVRVDRAVRSALQDGRDKARECALRSALHKDARAVRVHPLDLCNPLHRSGHLLREDIDDLLASILSGWVVAAGDVGRDGPTRRLNVQTLQHLLQRGRCRRDDGGVEGVTHGQRIHRDATGHEGLDGRLDRPRSAGDNRLG